MPSPYGGYGLSYKATDLQPSDGTIHLEVESGGPEDLPEIVGVDWVVPGAPGMVEGSRVALRRDIVLKGWIQAASKSAMRTLEQTIRTLFLPTAGPGNLVEELENGDTATIRARGLAIVWGPVYTTTRELTISLESTTDPEWTIT